MVYSLKHLLRLLASSCRPVCNDLKFLGSNFPMSLSGFSVIEHSIFLLHLLCVMSSYSLVVSEQFSQLAIFLVENSARAGLLQTEDGLPSSYD